MITSVQILPERRMAIQVASAKFGIECEEIDSEFWDLVGDEIKSARVIAEVGGVIVDINDTMPIDRRETRGNYATRSFR